MISYHFNFPKLRSFLFIIVYSSLLERGIFLSKEYRDEQKRVLEGQIRKVLKDAPSYVKDFYDHMHNGSREITTQAAYIRDIVNFIQYIIDTNPLFNETKVKDFPVEVFDQLTVKDLNEYRFNLQSVKHLAASSSKKKFAAISAFYKFANAEGYVSTNPMLNFELPATNKKRIIKLDAGFSKQLLDGILRNDMYLADTLHGKAPLPIPERVFLKREPLVLRNYAICSLFLGAGLRVSELVGLDLSDINFKAGTLNIIQKGGDEVQVFFGDEVAIALKTYIDGSFPPYELLEKYDNSEELLNWCSDHLYYVGFRKLLEEDFPDKEKQFYDDIELFCSSMRRVGRPGLKPKRNCNAVFISSRGSRMTVRMVEIMIKEMVQTYLPEYDDKEIFSPHKLRATCATRILSQTGDIHLASTQLNHKGIGVTAAFYAELQKEKQRDKIRNLDLHDW